jgi:hypothetical protein
MEKKQNDKRPVRATIPQQSPYTMYTNNIIPSEKQKKLSEKRIRKSFGGRKM